MPTTEIDIDTRISKARDDVRSLGTLTLFITVSILALWIYTLTLTPTDPVVVVNAIFAIVGLGLGLVSINFTLRQSLLYLELIAEKYARRK